MEYGRCLLTDRLVESRMLQQELADRAGIDKRQISDYIHHRKYMSILTAIRISRVLRCRVEDLYEFPDS